ncbi:MAG: hypothetical protein OXB94_14230 [Nitrospira sp.]|nr:hypothetical protein [Nitrospira sp.]
MSKKKLPKVSFPELEAMLEDMKELLTDEYGNPLPPDHPQVKKLQLLAQQLEGSTPPSPENEGGESLTGHA